MSGFTEYVTDCLVFKIVEMDVDTAEIDTTMYIIYDKTTRKYLIRGKRSDTSRFQSCTYSYDCEFASDLADFIQYLICQDNTVNEILYNFDELPENSNDITFEYLNEYDHPAYEISGYNNQKINRTTLLRNIRMLRNITN